MLRESLNCCLFCLSRFFSVNASNNLSVVVCFVVRVFSLLIIRESLSCCLFFLSRVFSVNSSKNLSVDWLFCPLGVFFVNSQRISQLFMFPKLDNGGKTLIGQWRQTLHIPNKVDPSWIHLSYHFFLKRKKLRSFYIQFSSTINIWRSLSFILSG